MIAVRGISLNIIILYSNTLESHWYSTFFTADAITVGPGTSKNNCNRSQLHCPISGLQGKQRYSFQSVRDVCASQMSQWKRELINVVVNEGVEK